MALPQEILDLSFPVKEHNFRGLPAPFPRKPELAWDGRVAENDRRLLLRAGAQ